MTRIRRLIGERQKVDTGPLRNLDPTERLRVLIGGVSCVSGTACDDGPTFSKRLAKARRMRAPEPSSDHRG
jgi:hypothetical protein